MPDPHLKPGHTPELSRQIAASYPGMAHFAGTGPTGKSCRECAFYVTDGYYSKTGGHRGALKPGRCRKYREMMRGQWGEKFSYAAQACKYFEQAEKPPTAFEK